MVGDDIELEADLDMSSDEHMYMDTIESSFNDAAVSNIERVLVLQDENVTREIHVSAKRVMVLRDNINIPMSKLVGVKTYFKGDALTSFPIAVFFNENNFTLVHLSGVVLSNHEQHTFSYTYSAETGVTVDFTSTNHEYELCITNVAYSRIVKTEETPSIRRV
jgi:hypothetical protein